MMFSELGDFESGGNRSNERSARFAPQDASHTRLRGKTV
jgi:hypothetical protein